MDSCTTKCLISKEKIAQDLNRFITGLIDLKGQCHEIF
jgi:hypothetical protein